ncbi:PREDICTED: UPF0415 protein C7orf25 homolog [Nicrophorus vespilloides]|uniref:UPF0415 protein C7orf25 homolog n=1 Tax=Nicrophorus vespilloides TaxID=110193 RepID=A0ABM1N3X6_NICVS|nr:PREDICTED: UPF0415 protein C7orf25 homolog [Nicrophorus vespilloides]
MSVVQEIKEDLIGSALSKIEEAENLLDSLKCYDDLDGMQKLSRKIKQELNFLKKIYKSSSIKKEHLQCSNLTHFSALVGVLRNTENCQCVNKPFNLDDRKIVVDMICDGGLLWIKVVARNPKSLSQICMGNAGYGVRSILDQAEEYLDCAQLYPCLFQTPQIRFVFANGIGTKLCSKLESMGIVVEGERLDNVDDNLEFDINPTSELSSGNTSRIRKVNLDVSTLLAYTSSVTNGSCMKYVFDVPVLNQQAEWECVRPVKTLLDAFFKDKKLYSCETAIESFREILHVVGGPNEIKRGEDFIETITVLPDDATVEDTEDHEDNEFFNSVQFTPDKSLPIGGKVKERSLIIFKFGDRIQAVTVTSNDGFVRAAKQQGIHFVVLVHESRALTEQKETTKARLK